jgi:hypothetical protein
VLHLAIAYNFVYTRVKIHPSFSIADGYDYLTVCMGSLLHTDCRAWTMWKIRLIRAQLAHIWWYPTFIKKDQHTLHQHSPLLQPLPLFCLSYSKTSEPAQSNDREDWSPSAQQLGGKGPVHLVIWTSMPIRVEDGWPPDRHRGCDLPKVCLFFEC